MGIKDVLKSESFTKALKALKNTCDSNGGGQAILKIEGSKIIDGWNWAIVVEAPDYEPETGEFSIRS